MNFKIMTKGNKCTQLNPYFIIKKINNMKKVILLFIFILCLINTSLFSQEKTEYKWAVKAYVNGTFDPKQEMSIFIDGIGGQETLTSSTMYIGQISPVITYTKNRFAQELELVNFNIDRSKNDRLAGSNMSSNSTNRRVIVGIRYLASGMFRPFKNKTIGLGIGGSMLPRFYHSRNKNESNNITNYLIKEFIFETTISAVPQIEYDFYKRFFINLSAPLDILNYSSVSSRRKNDLGVVDMRSRERQFNFFPKVYHLRMGLGVRF